MKFTLKCVETLQVLSSSRQLLVTNFIHGIALGFMVELVPIVAKESILQTKKAQSVALFSPLQTAWNSLPQPGHHQFLSDWINKTIPANITFMK